MLQMKFFLTMLVLCFQFTVVFSQTKGVSPGFTSFGTGMEKVIVLHDWNGDHNNFEPVKRYLSPTEFTYVFMDVRGQGLSKGIKGEYTIDEIARDVFSLADSLHWKQFHLVGHSFSAMAVQLAGGMDKSGRIKSIISICGLPAQGAPFTQENIAFLKAVVNSRLVAEQAMSALTGGRYSGNWARVKAQTYLETADSLVSRSYLNNFSTKDYSASVRGMAKPILILTAQWDLPLITLEKIRPYFEALNLQKASYIEIKECGHYPNEERPVFLATIMENFFRNHF